MKIAIDIDEVLADGLGSYLNYFNTTYGTQYRKEDFGPEKSFWETLDVAPERIAEVMEHYDDSPLSRDWYVWPGAQEGIARLKDKHELVVISNRMPPRFETSRVWLEKNFPGAFGEVYFTESERDGDVRPSKAEIGKRYGVEILVDDNLREALLAAEDGMRVLLFNNALNQGEVPSNVVRVKGWEEVERVLEAMGEVRD